MNTDDLVAKIRRSPPEGIEPDDVHDYVMRNRTHVEGKVGEAAAAERFAGSLVFVEGTPLDVNTHLKARHYLHRGRNTAQLAYFALLGAPERVQPGLTVVPKPPVERWTYGGYPIEATVQFAYPRLSVPLHAFHPMQFLELARVYVEPGRDGKVPPHVAPLVVARAVRRALADWRDRYPNVPPPSAILAYADKARREGAIFEAAGFHHAGDTLKGKRSTSRTGVPEHEDLAHSKARWILPIAKPDAQLGGYAVQVVVWNVSRRSEYEQLCQVAALVHATFGLPGPFDPEKCVYVSGVDMAELVFPVADEHGLVTREHPGAMLDKLTEGFREALGLMDFAEPPGLEVGIVRYDDVAFHRRKDGTWRQGMRPAGPEYDEDEPEYGRQEVISENDAAILLASGRFAPSVGIGAAGADHWRSPDGFHLTLVGGDDPVWMLHQDKVDPHRGMFAALRHLWTDVLGFGRR